MNDTIFASLIDPFVDAKFALGDSKKGWDCLNSLLKFYRSSGVRFPDEWKGYTEENYAEKWKRSETDCRKDFAEFLISLGSKLDNPRMMKPGDLLLFKGKEIPIFPAIYVGSGKMLMVFKEGVKIVPFNHFKILLTEVRRLV